MKFLVGEYDLPKLPPGTTAKKEILTYLDYQTAPTLEIAKNFPWYQGWFDRGKNHREDKERGMIVCEVQQEAFVVEIEHLSDLIKLLDRMDEASITKCDYPEAPLQIHPDSSW